MFISYEPTRIMPATLSQGATLKPAYGAVYTTAAEVIAAFEAGKDFHYNGMESRAGYCSIRDFKPGVIVQLRYGKKAATQLATYTTK